jgi:predicted transcriptional regulator
MPRISVDFSDEAYNQLAKLAEKKGKQKSEVLRDALAFERWYVDTVDEGARVLVERNDAEHHEVREVVRPR